MSTLSVKKTICEFYYKFLYSYLHLKLLPNQLIKVKNQQNKRPDYHSQFKVLSPLKPLFFPTLHFVFSFFPQVFFDQTRIVVPLLFPE